MHYEKMDTISLKSSPNCFGLGHGGGSLNTATPPKKKQKTKKINEHCITLSHKKPQHRKLFYFTENRSVKNTNIMHRKIWDQSNTAN